MICEIFPVFNICDLQDNDKYSENKPDPQNKPNEGNIVIIPILKMRVKRLD